LFAFTDNQNRDPRSLKWVINPLFRFLTPLCHKKSDLTWTETWKTFSPTEARREIEKIVNGIHPHLLQRSPLTRLEGMEIKPLVS